MHETAITVMIKKSQRINSTHMKTQLSSYKFNNINLQNWYDDDGYMIW